MLSISENNKILCLTTGSQTLIPECPRISKAGIYRETEELRRNFRAYLQDRWNYLDALGFLMLFGGMVSRISDSDNAWGRSLYALSAPMVFSRILFFAQILKFQGPMIQVSMLIRRHERRLPYQ